MALIEITANDSHSFVPKAKEPWWCAVCGNGAHIDHIPDAGNTPRLAWVINGSALPEAIVKCIDVVEDVDDVSASGLGGDQDMNDAYIAGGREMQRDILAALRDFKEASALSGKTRGGTDGPA